MTEIPIWEGDLEREVGGEGRVWTIELFSAMPLEKIRRERNFRRDKKV